MTRVALALSLAVALGLSAPPARAQALLKHTRLLDVTLRAEEGGGGRGGGGAQVAPAASTYAPAEPQPVRRSAVWAFLPFGIGQFANDQPVKGTLVCISELLMFATAGAALGILESSKVVNYGFMNGGKVQDEQLGKALMTTYIVAFWAGVAVVGIGIADALVYRPSESTTVAVAPTGVAGTF